jgi:hypothetical protein
MIALLPYGLPLGLRPSTIRLDQLLWPLGRPEKIAGKTLADLSPDDHLIVPPWETMHVRPSFGTRAKVSLLFGEPRAVHGQHMKMLRVTHRRFFKVLTADETLVSHIPNAVFFPVGGAWVFDWRNADTTKRCICSLIASSKRKYLGHALRHDVVDWIQRSELDVDIMGRGYKPFEMKNDGLAPYRYSVVIENVREKNYFSEKLVDALLCKTVPIYWGCPNIGDFFDTRAMVLCESFEDIQSSILTMSVAEYDKRVAALSAMLPIAESYADIQMRAAQAILDSIQSEQSVKV